MKKYPFFFILALIILVVSICTPNVMYASLPKVSYIKAEKQSTKKEVTVSGKITSKNDYIQFAKSKFLVNEILVNEGDYIQKGEKILKVTAKDEKYISSEFSGTISNILVESGGVCEQNTPIVNIIDTDNLCATLLIGEDVFSKVKLGQNLKLSGNAFNNKYKATITQIGATATQTATSATYIEAVAKIQNPDEKLKPGFNIKAKITVERLKDVIILPSRVISQDDNGEFVYKLIKNKAQKVYIKTDDITIQGTIVKTGVDDGDYIISNPQSIEKDDSYISLKGEEND